MSMLSLVTTVHKPDLSETPDFETVWKLFPRRVCKKAASVAWGKLDPDQKQEVLKAIPVHVRFWKSQRTEIRFIPHFSTWLNQERWTDELEMSMPVENIRRDF